MTNLITFSDLQSWKYISESVRNSATWSQFVQEAQVIDVKPWLGDELLNELMTQKATSPDTLTPANIALLDGGLYAYNSKNYLFNGLKVAIMYYAFARFTNRTPYNYTAAGIVVKDSDLSTPVSDKVVQRLETESRLTAEAMRDEVTLFLNRNRATYPLWRNSCLVFSTRNRPFTVMGE